MTLLTMTSITTHRSRHLGFITKKVLFTVALDSKSQIPYPSVFVDINTVDRGKMQNEAQNRPEKMWDC